jgi:thiol:disulfide interchange protein DsbC
MKYYRLWTFCLALCCTPLYAADDADNSEKVRAALSELIGAQVAKDASIEPAPIAGLYEAIIAGYVFYVSEDGKFIIRDGDILDLTQDAKNITEERRNGLRLDALKQVDIKDSINFKPEGESKYVVYVFTDVDCPYCSKLHKEVPEMNKVGIEIRYLAFPRAGMGSPTYKTMQSVWCAKDQQAAMTKAKNRESIDPLECDNPIEEEYKLGVQLGVTGTPAMILPDGKLLPGYAPADRLLQYLTQLDK